MVTQSTFWDGLEGQSVEWSVDWSVGWSVEMGT